MMIIGIEDYKNTEVILMKKAAMVALAALFILLSLPILAEDAATGVKLDVEEGVGVFNGDGSEQPWRELCPIEATLVVGEYFRMTLAELGYDVPTDGTPYSKNRATTPTDEFLGEVTLSGLVAGDVA